MYWENFAFGKGIISSFSWLKCKHNGGERRAADISKGYFLSVSKKSLSITQLFMAWELGSHNTEVFLIHSLDRKVMDVSWKQRIAMTNNVPSP